MLLTNNKLPDVFPPELSLWLVNNGDANAALDSLMKEEESTASQFIAVLHNLHMLNKKWLKMDNY